MVLQHLHKHLHKHAKAVHAHVKKYTTAIRLPFLVASLLPAAAAGALAWREGVFDLFLFSLATLAVVAAHAGTNLANDYFDYQSGNYAKKKTGPTGGSFAIQSKLFTAREILELAVGCFALSLIIFAFLAVKTSPMILVLGAIGVGIGYFYTAPPISLGYRHLGELATFIGIGPLVVQTIYYAQSGTFSLAGWPLSVFLGVMVSNVLVAAELPDIAIDQKVGKRTVAAVHGPEAGHALYLFSLLLGALALIAGVLWMGLYPTALLGLAGTFVGWKAYRQLQEERLLEGLGGTLAALQLGGLLVILGLLITF